MSTSQRVRKTSPVKQGPMKATIPMASLLRHSNNLRKSPTLSPTSGWRSRISPDVSSSGQRSPGSITYKGKSKTLTAVCENSGNVIRRTASLDAIYLKGQWPRDSFYLHSGLLQVDKATQTEDVNTDARKSQRLSDSCVSNDDKLDKFLRQRLQRSSKDGSSGNGRAMGVSYGSSVLPSTSCQTGSIICMLPTPTTKASPVNIPVKPIAKPPMRNSIEGLNQEIEKLVLKATGSYGVPSSDKYEEDKFQQITPEGHRAPLADLLRSTRSVNTQTPAASDLTGSCQSSGPPSRESGSPLIPGPLDVSRPTSEQGGSHGSSPDQDPHKLGTSPHINRFLAREPPDGCEKVNLKFLENPPRQPVIDLSQLDYCPLKPCVTFQLKPSLGSAFYPLHPVANRAAEEMEDLIENMPIVPQTATAAEQDIV